MITGWKSDANGQLYMLTKRNDHDPFTNLNKAVVITDRIAKLQKVQSAIKYAFKHRELEGGINAANGHPLYKQAEAEILDLQEALTLLI